LRIQCQTEKSGGEKGGSNWQAVPGVVLILKNLKSQEGRKKKKGKSNIETPNEGRVRQVKKGKVTVARLSAKRTPGRIGKSKAVNV